MVYIIHDFDMFDRLKNCSRLKETIETQEVNAICYPGLDPGPDFFWFFGFCFLTKAIIGTTSKI